MLEPADSMRRSQLPTKPGNWRWLPGNSKLQRRPWSASDCIEPANRITQQRLIPDGLKIDVGSPVEIYHCAFGARTTRRAPAHVGEYGPMAGVNDLYPAGMRHPRGL